MDAVPTFSSVTLHDCILDSSVPVPVTLNVSPSFPGCRVRVLPRELPPTTKAWVAQPVQQDGSHLDLTLTEPVGEGRRGMTYIALVNSAKDASGADLLASGLVPSELVLKIAKPQFCRSMAREAWFYEQMRTLQGVAIARCFGFLTATLKGARTGLSTASEDDDSGSLAMTAVPWDAAKSIEPELRFKKDHWPSDDSLIDDSTSPLYTDEHGFKKDSPWNNWQHSEDLPLLSILVLEKLGESYYLPQDEPQGEEREDLHSSSRAIVTDMANIGVWHGDITAFNILRMSAESKAICPTHKRVHGWRLTDFDQATKMDPENCLKEDILTLASQPSSVSVSFRGFWGFHGR